MATTQQQIDTFLEAVRKEPLPDGGGPSRVRLDSGFDTVIVEITEDDGGWWVEGAGYYRTHHGLVVQDARKRHFPKEARAREYANGWVAHHEAKGFARNPHTDCV